MKKPIRIGIADNNLFVRQGLISLLKRFEKIKVKFNVDHGEEVSEMVKKHKPDVLLLDIEMPANGNTDIFDSLKLHFPSLKIIVLSSYYTDSYIITCIKNGVSGFLCKSSGIEKMVATIETVHEQGFYYDHEVSAIMAKTILEAKVPVLESNQPSLHLTDREIEIIGLICMNKTNNEIAKELFISVRTVEGHRLHIRKKTDCKSLVDLANFAIRNRLMKLSA